MRGDYIFPADEDLPFMSIVHAFGKHIPFRRLLEIVNETHRNGLAGSAGAFTDAPRATSSRVKSAAAARPAIRRKLCAAHVFEIEAKLFSV